MTPDWLNSQIAEKTIEIVLAFDERGRILFGNHAACEKLGYTPEELKGCNMTQLFRQEFQKENGAYEPFAKGKLFSRSETAMYRKNSSCFPAVVRFFDVSGRNGYLLAEDITAQKNVDMRIRQIQEEEENNRKMRDEFTANVTHELRTPVNGIKGHVMALMETVQEPEQKKALEVISYCCDNMAAIINNILDFSKLEAGKFTLEEREFDFYQMMDRVFSTHMASINRKELRFGVYIDDKIPRYMIGDELRITQILNNLLSNAVKFTTVGGVNVDVSRTLQVNDEIELFFIVRDTGIGISREEQDKLFQSYRQVDASITRRFGGTGLGLSISRQLVEMMKGSIRLESEKGRGSSFAFSIRLRTNSNADENGELSGLYQKWSSFTGEMEPESEERFKQFGTQENEAELRKRMEKLVLSIELGAWEKAESTAETVKVLTQEGGADLKRQMLRLEMAIRKEDHEKSLEQYEELKRLLIEKLGEPQRR